MRGIPTYRCLAERLARAVREEVVATGGLEEVPPSMRGRYGMLLRALADPETPEEGFRCHLCSYVVYVEVCYQAYRGRPVLLGGRMGAVYDAAVDRLRLDRRYPLRWSPRWARYRGAYEAMQPLRARMIEREISREASPADTQGVPPAAEDDFGAPVVLLD